MHPREQIIRSMARTLIVESFASWAEKSENAAQAQAYQAKGGQDWMDTTPAMSPKCQEAALLEAAVLYGAIKQAWGTEPWILVHTYSGMDHDQDLKDWGHYAVMSCIGHGVCWEDSHTKLVFSGAEYDLHEQAPHIESLDMDWADETKKWEHNLEHKHG